MIVVKIIKNQTYIANTKLSSIKFENKDIINIITSSRVSMIVLLIDHGYYNISITMLKVCDSAIVEPLSTIT